MFEFLTGALGAVASLAGLFILGIILLVLALLSYRKSPPDEAMVVTGMGKKRFVVGNSAFVVPILQRVDRLYLGAVQALLSTEAPIPTKEAIRQNELDLKEAELKKAADKARAEADMVFQTITAERTRELNIAQQEAEIAAEAKRIELKEKAVAVKERELEAEVKKQAEADRYAAEQKAEAALYAEQKDAEAVRVKAEAKAAEIVAIGKAEGEAEEARGSGIAQAARKQIEAYNAAENANFLADRYIAVMPEIARAVASPLASVDGITMYGSGNAAALVEETTQMASQVNAGLSDALGIDLKDVLSGIVAGTAAGRAAGAAQAQAEE